MPGRFAIDIETVSPPLDRYEVPPDFRDPQYFELLAVVLGYESPSGERETEMLFRRDDSPADELALGARVLEWMEAREGDSYLTYGGESFDRPQMVGRLERATDACSGDRETVSRLTRLLDEELEHDDLQPSAWDAFGDYTRLEEACRNVGLEPADTLWADYEHGIALDEVRPSKIRGFEKVLNKDIPVFGERYIALSTVGATETLTFRALSDLLEHYGREDIVHLFDVADARPFGDER